MKPGHNILGVALVILGMLDAAALMGAPDASAQPAWNGRYQMITYASQKGGTSPATRQRENDFGGEFTLATACSGAICSATVVAGPRPGNPTIPQPTRYTWNGSDWVNKFEWAWDCYLGDSYQKVWSPATSWAFYTPQSDGTLRGTWHTDISDGPCRGSVVMPVAAVPLI